MSAPFRRRITRWAAAAVAGASLAGAAAVAPASPAGAQEAPSIPCPETATEPAEQYLCAVYALRLRHTPSQAELDYWVGVVGSQGLGAAAHGIAFSQEHWETLVIESYQAVLGRAPESEAAIDHWAAIASDAGRIEVVQADLFLTDEFLATLPASDPATLVGAHYTTMLGREAGAAEIGYWASVLEATGSVRTVQLGILQSAERMGLVVDVLYEVVLGRDADPAGRAYWTQVGVDRGTNGLLAAFAGSADVVGEFAASL